MQLVSLLNRQMTIQTKIQLDFLKKEIQPLDMYSDLFCIHHLVLVLQNRPKDLPNPTKPQYQVF